MAHDKVRLSVLLAFALAGTTQAAADDVLCIGRGTGAITTQGAFVEDAQAGGAQPTILCSDTDDICFDVSSAQGSARTRGGAGPSVGAQPGSPAVETTVAGAVVDLGEGDHATAGRSRARAASPGDLFASSGATIVELDGETIILDGGDRGCNDAGDVLEIPGRGLLIAGRTTCTHDRLFSEIVIDSLAVQFPAGVSNEAVYSRSAAGVEIPFAGSGGCTAVPGDAPRSADAMLVVLATTALLVSQSSRRGAPGGSRGRCRPTTNRSRTPRP